MSALEVSRHRLTESRYFQLLDHDSGTACRPNYNNLTLPSVPPGVKDIFVCLTDTPAPSDFLFVVCYTNVLTYLFTYLYKSTFTYLITINNHAINHFQQHLVWCRLSPQSDETVAEVSDWMGFGGWLHDSGFADKITLRIAHHHSLENRLHTSKNISRFSERQLRGFAGIQ